MPKHSPREYLVAFLQVSAILSLVFLALALVLIYAIVNPPSRPPGDPGHDAPGTIFLILIGLPILLLLTVWYSLLSYLCYRTARSIGSRNAVEPGHRYVGIGVLLNLSFPLLIFLAAVLEKGSLVFPSLLVLVFGVSFALVGFLQLRRTRRKPLLPVKPPASTLE